MIIYFFPTGLSTIKLRHVFLAQMFYWVLIYRFVSSIFFPSLQVKITAFAADPAFSVEFLSALFQSLITPFTQPDLPSMDHTVLTIISSLGVIAFWLVFGSSFEMRLKKNWFGLIFCFSILLAAAVAILPVFTLNPVYWLGHGMTFFFLGLTFTLFLQDDVKIFYHYFTIFGTHNQGTVEFPAPIFSAILLLFLTVPTTMYWYPEDKAFDLALRYALVPPIGWVSMLVGMGAVFGMLTEKIAPVET